MKYYKHRSFDTYIMVSPIKVIKTYGDSIVQYTKKDYCFDIESDVDTSVFNLIPEHEFRLALIQVIETLIHTLKKISV